MSQTKRRLPIRRSHKFADINLFLSLLSDVLFNEVFEGNYSQAMTIFIDRKTSEG